MSDMSNYFEIAERKGAVLLDASNFELDAFPVMSFIKDVFAELAEGKSDLGYDNPSGSGELRKLIADHESFREGIYLIPENVVINNGGATGAINNILWSVGIQQAGTSKMEVICPIPSYPEIIRSVEYNNLHPRLIAASPKNDFIPDAQEIIDKINGRTAAIFLTSPGNPVTTTIGTDSLARIIEKAEQFGAYVILDSIFEESASQPSLQPFFSLTGYKRLIKLKSWSKDRPHMNDFRVGYSISPDPQTIDALGLASEVHGFSVSMAIDKILRSEMELRLRLDRMNEQPPRADLQQTQLPAELSTYINELDSFFAKIKSGKEAMHKICKYHPSVEEIYSGEAGNLLYIKINKDSKLKHGLADSTALYYHLLEKTNIAIMPGHIFYSPKEELYFRITMSKDPSAFVTYTEEILEALK